jgi:hypothetical protein
VKKPTILVIGGGINGRMVQHIIPSATVLDWSGPPTGDPTPKFYGANYLWRPIPGVACRHVEVRTTIDGKTPTVEGIRAYKKRIGKEHELTAPGELTLLQMTQFKPSMDGYEIERWPASRITYAARVSSISAEHRQIRVNDSTLNYDLLVSTIPLPSILSMMGQRGLNGIFRSQKIKVRVRPTTTPFGDGLLWVDYVTDPAFEEYRRTVRGQEIHDETLGNFPGEQRVLTPGKIWDTPRSQEFLEELESRDIYCFGRYGAWRSDELVHHTVKRIWTWAQKLGLEVNYHG